MRKRQKRNIGRHREGRGEMRGKGKRQTQLLSSQNKKGKK